MKGGCSPQNSRIMEIRVAEHKEKNKPTTFPNLIEQPFGLVSR
jgi:hypothetical protein